MANAIHTQDRQTTQTKEFDFVFVEEAALAETRIPYKTYPAPATANTSSSLDAESLNRFHEEFKRLVLDSNSAHLKREESGWEELRIQEPIEPHEIEWLNWAVAEKPTAQSVPVRPSAPARQSSKPISSQPVPQIVAPQQTIRPMTGPPLGTPPPIELWVVKSIGLLVALNVLFASLIVSGSRISSWLKW